MTQELPFGVAVHNDDNCLRLDVTGELDIAFEQDLVERARDAIAATKAPTVVIDLRRVSFIDSSGLRALLVCRDTAKERGVALLLAVEDGPVGRLLEVAGVRDWFDYE
ncbi:MAG: anti-sigma factor antagonist [Acidimicrobiaceae bacterium]|jgi:anti-anti-sigma factor